MQRATGQGKASPMGDEETVEGGEGKRAASTARSKSGWWDGILDVVGRRSVGRGAVGYKEVMLGGRCVCESGKRGPRPGVYPFIRQSRRDAV